jgi:hypothetical protein
MELVSAYLNNAVKNSRSTKMVDNAARVLRSIRVKGNLERPPRRSNSKKAGAWLPLFITVSKCGLSAKSRFFQL